MRAEGCHLGEVGLNGLECLVFGSTEEVGELSLMNAVVVDLLVVEPGGADELVRPESMQEYRAQPRIRGERPVLGKPLRERAGTEVQAETFPDVGGNTLACLSLVVAHDGIKNNGQGESFAFGNLRGEHAVAVVTPPELDGFK